jgi:CRISPR type I-E-associated protein CasB/Cse2
MQVDHGDVPSSDRSLMSVVEQRLRANREGLGRRPYSGFLAAVRCGLTPQGDLQAHAVTAPYTIGLTGSQARGARRAAAIRATHKDVPRTSPGPSIRLGGCLADLFFRNEGWYPSDKGDEAQKNRGGEQIVQQIGVMGLLDTDEAALILHQLVGRCAVGVPVDFEDLARTLIYWGNGISAQSTKVRQRVVSDFYARRKPEPTSDTNNQPASKGAS